MAVTVSKADAKRALTKLESIRGRINRIKEKAEEKTDAVVHAGIAVGTAFGMGVLQGKTGGVHVFGVPLDLGVGALGLGAGLLDVGGNASKHLIAVGTGSLAAYAATMGRGVGQSMGGSSSGSTVAAQNLKAGGVNLSPLEILEAQRRAAVG